MYLIDFAFSLEIGSTVLAFLGAAIIIALLIVFAWRRSKVWSFDIDGCDIGLTGASFHLACTTEHRQIAHKVWTEINTRALGTKIDFEVDTIRAIHDSYYACFIATRELIKAFPVSQLKKDEDVGLVDLMVEFLNKGLRPYLTRWGMRFNAWYDDQRKKVENEDLSPVELQKKFPEYNELAADLLSLNEKMSNYSSTLRKIALGQETRAQKERTH